MIGIFEAYILHLTLRTSEEYSRVSFGISLGIATLIFELCDSYKKTVHFYIFSTLTHGAWLDWVGPGWAGLGYAS